PGCGDGMGAHLIEEAGFRTGFVSGSSISAMRLAMPDMDLLSFPEMADAVEACIAAAPKVLWLADGDTGYGNALAVQKAIRAYAQAILAATVRAVRAALGGLKGGRKPPMAGPAELATAIRSTEYLALDARWADPR